MKQEILCSNILPCVMVQCWQWWKPGLPVEFLIFLKPLQEDLTQGVGYASVLSPSHQKGLCSQVQFCLQLLHTNKGILIPY